MMIEEYSFGRIRIDGRVYTKDVIILGGQVRSPWWRKAGGHLFAPVDLEEVIAAAPETVVLGTGYHDSVQVGEDTLEVFRTAGTRAIVLPTARAVDEFNRLAAEGGTVAAALHLTC
jgi:hypothetical protein